MDEKNSVGEEREVSPNKIDYLSSGGESSVWLTLSPIVELNEISIVDSTISDVQDEEISFTETAQDNNHDLYEKSVMKNDCNNLSSRPNSLQLPELPSKDLRNSLSKLEWQYEYLKHEHEDLIEFTRLEKQILHEDCVSKEKMKSLEDEFAQVNSKVFALIQENEDFVTKLECKDEEIKELKIKLESYVCYKKEIGQTILEIGQKLKEDIQMDVKDILKNNPSFELLLSKEDLPIEVMPSRNEMDETATIFKTLKEIYDLFILTKNGFKFKIDSLHLNNETLNKTINKLSRQLQDTESILKCANYENEKLPSKLNTVNIKDTENMNSTQTTQNEIRETLPLHEIENKDNQVTQGTNTPSFYPHINLSMDNNLDSTIKNHVHKIKTKLDSYTEEKLKTHQQMEELKYLLNTYKNENICLKNNIEDLKSKYFTKTNDVQEQKCLGQCLEQLNTLRETMIVEITSLNFEESKKDLQKCSSIEIFRKLMQNIIKKEAEITLDLQKQIKGDIEIAQNERDKLHHKCKSQESWITSLENENDRMHKEVVHLKNHKEELECKIKCLSTSLKCNSSEMSLLKSKLSELANENDTMRNTVCNLKKAIESERGIVQSSKILISDLREELISKTKEIANLMLLCDVKKSDTSKDIKLENISTKTLPLSCCEPPTENITIFDSNYSTVESSYHFIDNRKLKNSTELKSKTENRSDQSVNTQMIAIIEKEKEILMQALAAKHFNNVKDMLPFNKPLLMLKDVFIGVINKIADIENSHAEEISYLQNCVFVTSKELAELKSNLEQLYKDLSLDLDMSGVDGFMESNSNLPWMDSISLKKELDLVKEECEFINKKSLEIENSAKTSNCLIHTVRQEFQVIKSEICKKEKIIDELKNNIVMDQKKYCDQETEFLRQISTLNVQNAHSIEQVNQLQSQLSVITSGFTDSIISFPVEMSDIKSKMDYINDIFKQKVHQENVIDNLIGDIDFFSGQCNLMRSYIKIEDHCLKLTKKENEQLTSRVDLLNYQVTSLNKSCNEKNVFLSNVITELQKKTKTHNENVELVQEICIEYGNLNKSELSFLQDCKKNAEQVILLQNEIKMSNNIIESLKSELNNCEDQIRNLRSELRSVRSKHRRQAIRHSVMRDEKNEVGIQTESLCCSYLNDQLEEEKKRLDARCCQITSLKLQLQENSESYQKKVSDLEQALVKAKEKIFTLKNENNQCKTYNTDLIESYNWYKEQLSKASKEMEILKTQLQTHQ